MRSACTEHVQCRLSYINKLVSDTESQVLHNKHNRPCHRRSSNLNLLSTTDHSWHEGSLHDLPFTTDHRQLHRQHSEPPFPTHLAQGPAKQA
jgi:hypothetical protein